MNGAIVIQRDAYRIVDKTLFLVSEECLGICQTPEDLCGMVKVLQVPDILEHVLGEQGAGTFMECIEIDRVRSRAVSR